jgi:hypothetical protein
MQEHRLVAFSEDGLRKIQDRIESLRVDLGASGALLLDQSGQLLVESGHHADLDLQSFLALLGNAMSAMNAVVHLLKDEGAFDLHFHEGRIYDMHTARIDDRIFLALIFERHIGSSRVGMIWLSLRRTVTELRKLMKKGMIKSGTAESDDIKSAVSDALGEAISRMDEDLFSSIPSIPSMPIKSSDQSMPHMKEPPPQVSPDVSKDPKHVLTYDEARALGLINLDDSQSS